MGLICGKFTHDLLKSSPVKIKCIIYSSIVSYSNYTTFRKIKSFVFLADVKTIIFKQWLLACEF